MSVEDLNEVSPNSSWIFVDDCENEEENSEQNVYYLNCSSEDSYDKLQESDSDSVSIISESDGDLEPASIDAIAEIQEEPLDRGGSYSNFMDKEEYLFNKILTCGCIFLAIFTPVAINYIMTESLEMARDEYVKGECEKFLGLDVYDADTHFEYEEELPKNTLEHIPDVYTPMLKPTLEEIKQNDEDVKISEEVCVKTVTKNDHETITPYNRRVKVGKFKHNKLKHLKKGDKYSKDFQAKKDSYFDKKQRKGDKWKKQESKKPHKKPKSEKAKGEFPLKYKDKTRKPEKSCSGEITKLKSLLDNQQAKIRQLSRLLSDKDRDIKLLERRILQEIKDLKHIKKTYDENKLNSTLSGEWYNNYFNERGKLRSREQASSWLFDRADFRTRKRNHNWYVDWMAQRESERTKRDDWRFTY